ncbi:unnamed protein product [Brassica oleracea var. botrytis]|uniref:Uncharacterized protein n=2 Tax=Brassica TaxID=3705 RepID=A0A3P6FFP2_BRAOL|nr:unnamed protein product [Brassica napus]CDY55214.1 BnaCnng28500D [Brassica napus]VDD46494.1 unnamed protein product [Brassica oleracea]
MVTLDEQTRSGESQLRNGGCGGGGGNKKTDSSLSTVVPLEHLRQLRRSNGCSRVTGRRQADPRDDG